MLNFSDMRVVVDCCSFRSQMSVELFCVFLQHLILNVLVFPFVISSHSLGLRLHLLL
jgi:hypothetical protein